MDRDHGAQRRRQDQSATRARRSVVHSWRAPLRRPSMARNGPTGTLGHGGGPPGSEQPDPAAHGARRDRVRPPQPRPRRRDGRQQDRELVAVSRSRVRARAKSGGSVGRPAADGAARRGARGGAEAPPGRRGHRPPRCRSADARARRRSRANVSGDGHTLGHSVPRRDPAGRKCRCWEIPSTAVAQ